MSFLEWMFLLICLMAVVGLIADALQSSLGGIGDWHSRDEKVKEKEERSKNS